MITGKWIVLIGAPGCGKGSQCELLAGSEFFFKIICVGDILRKSKDMFIPQLGKTVRDILGRGILLPDDAIVSLVETELSKMSGVNNQNLIFDGFPRTIGQAEALLAITESFSQKLSYAFNFEIPDDVLVKRILGRFNCENCGKIYNDFFAKPKLVGVCDECGGTEFTRRKDDNEHSLKVRLSEYHSKTQPLIDFYKKQGILYSINADKEKSVINKEILSLLSNSN